MRVFVDTEFTDFIECDLVSIGFVADDGREFYGERSDYDRAGCNEFVRAAVLSQLGQYPGRVFTREALRTALVAWLDQFADEPERVLCCALITSVTGSCCVICSMGRLQDGRRTTWASYSIRDARMLTTASIAAGTTRWWMRAQTVTQ
jgi:hypothetical protein